MADIKPFAIYDPSEAQDQDDAEMNWSDFKVEINARLKTVGKPGGIYLVRGENMGWQHRSGYKYISNADNAAALLMGFLPKTDC